ENANVTATSVAGGVNRTARTDRGGRFTISFPGGEGDYFVSFTAIGYAPRRFEVRRTAAQESLVAHAQLQHRALLDTARAVASRARVNRNETGPDLSGTEQSILNGAVPSAQQGDLNAMAGTIPGVTPITDPNGDPAGFSVLGLSADQNSTTLNGANFGASNVPRDAQVVSSLVTTPYDVSRGGFSGAQFSLRSGGGSNFIRRTNTLNFDAPPLHWPDRAARARRRSHERESRRPGPAHVVREEHPPERDDAQPERQPQLRHALPRDAQRLRARKLDVPRRYERRAHARFRRQRVHGHEQQHPQHRGDQPTVMVQPEQQAPAQAEQRAPSRELRS